MVFIAEGFDNWPYVDPADLVRRGVAFSSLAPGEVLCFTGRFSAHWESDDGQEFREGPDDVTVEDAIAWGRAEADVVLVRVGNGDLGGDDEGYFSAGTRHPDPEIPLWPEEGMTVTVRPYQGRWKAGVDWFEVGGSADQDPPRR